MVLEKTIEELLSFACPSIQFRLRREILGEDPDTAGMQALQVKIIQDEAVNDIIRSQHPGGWLGDRFHGYDGLEAGIRTLCEKGVNSWQPVLVRAICALETNPERIIQEMGTAGKVLDEGGYGGTTMMQAVTFA